MVEELIKDPSLILNKAPFHRGCEEAYLDLDSPSQFVGADYLAELPKRMSIAVSQERFLQELDPMCHKVHFDDTIPDIAVQKGTKGSVYLRQKGIRIAFNYQEIIANKRCQYLCGNPTVFTLCNPEPSEETNAWFSELKEFWKNKNMDIWRYKLVRSQMRTGDGAVLHYFKKNGGGRVTLKHRLLSFEDGYVLLPHYDENGELVLFGIYYKAKDREKLDVYDSTYLYRFENNTEQGWQLVKEPSKHGFEEVPITYKRGEPAWNKVQNVIDIYEVLYNTYTIVQKRFGSSVLWVKGNYDARTRKQGWAVVLNASSLDQHADAKILSPAEPVGMQNLLADMKKHIQQGSSTVILSPEDVKVSGDLSGVAVKLLMSGAYENACQEALAYDDVADSMLRLFIYGIGIEATKSTQYDSLIIRAEFKAWMPQSDTDIINNINNSVAVGSLSVETGSLTHPYASPDEPQKIKLEALKKAETQISTSAVADGSQSQIPIKNT